MTMRGLSQPLLNFKRWRTPGSWILRDLRLLCEVWGQSIQSTDEMRHVAVATHTPEVFLSFQQGRTALCANIE